MHAIAAKFDPISIIDLWRKPIRPIEVKFQVARRSRSATSACSLLHVYSYMHFSIPSPPSYLKLRNLI